MKGHRTAIPALFLLLACAARPLVRSDPPLSSNSWVLSVEGRQKCGAYLHASDGGCFGEGGGQQGGLFETNYLIHVGIWCPNVGEVCGVPVDCNCKVLDGGESVRLESVDVFLEREGTSLLDGGS